MGKAEQRTKDSAMAAGLLRRNEHSPTGVAAAKKRQSEARLRAIQFGGPGTARYRRYVERRGKR